MAIIAVLMDSRPEYLGCNGASLLQMPLAASTVLGHLEHCVESIGVEECLIMPIFPVNPDYEQAIRDIAGNRARIVIPDGLAPFLRAHEPSDSVLVLDPRYWPADGFNLARVTRDRHDNRWTFHAVAVVADADGTNERVICDFSGCVQRIRRYYNGLTWPQMSEVSWSLVPLPAIMDTSFTCLSELRRALAIRGMLSHDIPPASGFSDLTRERAFLALNERFLLRGTTDPVPEEYDRTAEGVLVGKGCVIDPSVRIIAPVLIQPGVVVERGAMIVGPCVLGAGSTVARGALVAQSVLARDSMVKPEAVERHRVCAGDRPSVASYASSDGGTVPLHVQPICSYEIAQASGAPETIEASIRRRIYVTVKLSTDVLVALLGLVVLAPLLIIVAILVKLESRGPVFFAHGREGKGGRVFQCLKFRTMCEDAHRLQRKLYQASAVDGPQFKMERDPRITRIGRWLRATNIDELPQLINVLRGQMSLIGPRPSPFRENQICVPWRRARLSVRPGITGLWQVCRHDRSEGDFYQWIYYDMLYVQHRSLWLDLKILFFTLVTFGARWSTPLSRLIPPRALQGEPDGRVSSLAMGNA
jgi:lipopolysaccharide/colanic/teichoic acid biosynthesis glycosyltransferase